MSVPFEQRGSLPSQCPLCGSALTCEPPADTHCLECGGFVWFRKRTADDVVILDALPGRIPEPEDIKHLCESLVQSGTPLRLAVNLSQADIVHSTFIASLVGLRKRLLATKGRLVLYSLRPAMRDVLGDTQLDKFFDIFDTEEDALSALRSATG